MPYDETRIDYFDRLANMFAPNSPTQIYDPYDVKQVDKNTALELYGHYYQGMYGDVKGERPVVSNLEQAEWDAWNQCKGMTKEEAREFFIETAEDFLKAKGQSLDDPKKEQIEKAYNECVARLQWKGIEKQRIEDERDRQIEERAEQQRRQQEEMKLPEEKDEEDGDGVNQGGIKSLIGMTVVLVIFVVLILLFIRKGQQRAKRERKQAEIKNKLD